jgi:hypothetical protein
MTSSIHSIHPDLIRVGNELEVAVRREIDARSAARRRRLRSRVVASVAVATGVVAIAGTAAATGLFSASTVESGLPGGTSIFEGTQPSCTTTDGVVFDCKLASAPVPEWGPSGMQGAKEPFVDENNIVAGGCVGQDPQGLHWVCYAGQRAVDEHVLTPTALGQHVDGPTSG